jgi:RNA polymerase sigma-70 factor (ECF subfamily)
MAIDLLKIDAMVVPDRPRPSPIAVNGDSAPAGAIADPDAAAQATRAAFEALMRRNNRRLFRTARAILRDDAAAEDALQEAYVAAYRKLDTFRGDAEMSTWLTRIVVNQALQMLRKSGRERVVVNFGGIDDRDAEPGAEIADESSHRSPEDAAMRSEIRRLIECKIDDLPQAFRTVFVLREVEELSVEETARCLELPEATVRTRLFRAKARLRESIARDLDIGAHDVFAFDGTRCDRIVAAVLQRIALQPGPAQCDPGG